MSAIVSLHRIPTSKIKPLPVSIAKGTNDRMVYAINGMPVRSLWTSKEICKVAGINVRGMGANFLTYYKKEGFIIVMGKDRFQYLWRRVRTIPKSYLNKQVK